MKTIKYLAEKGCKVKINGKFYSGNQVIPVDEMTDEEIQQLIKAKFIKKLSLDEGDSDDGDSKGAGEKISKERKALVKKAAKLEIEVTDEMTDEEIQQLIDEKEAGAQ